jgi:hypothetical protein
MKKGRVLKEHCCIVNPQRGQDEGIWNAQRLDEQAVPNEHTSRPDRKGTPGREKRRFLMSKEDEAKQRSWLASSVGCQRTQLEAKFFRGEGIERCAHRASAPSEWKASGLEPSFMNFILFSLSLSPASLPREPISLSPILLPQSCVPMHTTTKKSSSQPASSVVPVQVPPRKKWLVRGVKHNQGRGSSGGREGGGRGSQ